MQEHFDCAAVEHRQQFLWNDVFMKNYPQMGTVSPRRNLALGGYHQENIVDKGHARFNSTQKILQRSPVSEALFFPDCTYVFLVIRLPYRVETIHKSDDSVHIQFLFK